MVCMLASFLSRALEGMGLPTQLETLTPDGMLSLDILTAWSPSPTNTQSAPKASGSAFPARLRPMGQQGKQKQSSQAAAGRRRMSGPMLSSGVRADSALESDASAPGSCAAAAAATSSTIGATAPAALVPVAVEVHGPQHYLASHPTRERGGQSLRDALIRARGYALVIVPVYEWSYLKVCTKGYA